jgi:uncharacterized damage-inducible protein DinB
VSDSSIALLLRNLEQAFDRRAWHGTNLWGSLRGLTPEEAAWRPHPDRHNVWELLVHAAYWKYRVRRLLTDAGPRAFELRGSNFFPRPAAGEEQRWDSDLALLKGWHERLLDAVREFPSGRLEEPVGSNGYTHQDLILGAASHDLYHAGQIQLLKRLREETLGR